MNRTNLVEDLTLIPLPPWWTSPWAIAAAVMALVALGLVARWLARRTRRPDAPQAPPAGPPIDLSEFTRRLAALRQRRPQLSAYDLAIEVSDILLS